MDNLGENYTDRFMMQTAACASKVEMRISCKGLQDKDVLSKSDPMVAVYLFEGSRWVEVSQIISCVEYDTIFEHSANKGS